MTGISFYRLHFGVLKVLRQGIYHWRIAKKSDLYTVTFFIVLILKVVVIFQLEILLQLLHL
ncbi:hypothetical protein SAMN04488574_103316 [Bacillus sp. 71mf]|nr:hypothetical protein SAMN04488574_103316 [Bacillus sp. 71mf]SFS45475.1 hypothetical protein SAMN04488145_101586 [Bacillus sp. 103mf]